MNMKSKQPIFNVIIETIQHFNYQQMFAINSHLNLLGRYSYNEKKYHNKIRFLRIIK